MKTFCSRMVALMCFIACLSIAVSAETQANDQLDQEDTRTAKRSITAAGIIDEYRLDTGDKISIRVSGEPDMDISVRLGTSGDIRYPLLGKIHVSGMTPAELEQKITSGLANGYLINPHVRVSIEEFTSFYAKGEVAKPGAYPYPPGLTVRKAISLAGGFTEDADENEMFLIHAGDTRKGESEAHLDQKMQSGDILTVKRAAKKETAVAKSTGEYRLDAGDQIKIQVFGEKNLDVSAHLGASGDIRYPFLGKIHVSGMTPPELEQKITRELADGYLSAPQVRVTIEKFRPFYASGEVKKPGAYPYQPGLTVRKAISLAGGFTDKADENKVYLDHAGRVRKKIALDQRIQPGDILTVKQSFFYVGGEVRRPGKYPYKSDMTTRTAISVAGGFTAAADENNVTLIQAGDVTSDGKSRIPLDYKIQPGDILTVKESFFYVNGEVKRPGKYRYQPGLSYRMAISMAGGMKERADEDKVFVIHKGEHKSQNLSNLDAEEVKSGDMITVKESFF
jgi:protein involved in polysaccharide export with SLBB domain